MVKGFTHSPLMNQLGFPLYGVYIAWIAVLVIALSAVPLVGRRQGAPPRLVAVVSLTVHQSRTKSQPSTNSER